MKRTHGASKSSEFYIWCGMRNRCDNPNNSSYRRYGGRGIRVCPAWGSFENFLRDMGHRPTQKHTIERKDNDGPYAPFNCVWSTRKEQSYNREATIVVTRNGETKCLKEWCEIMGLKYWTVHSRVRRGLTGEQALEPGRFKHGDVKRIKEASL